MAPSDKLTLRGPAVVADKLLSEVAAALRLAAMTAHLARLLLRISGKRTLSRLNAFDLVVTVALGSTLATVLLSKDVAALEGDAMRDERVTLAELEAAARGQGIASLDEAGAVILETDGSLHVLPGHKPAAEVR